jgi:hypothetical protein
MVSTQAAEQCNKTGNSSIRSLIAEIRRGIEMIEWIDDRVYTNTAIGTGSIGGQFRHNLDFVNCFLKGVDTGRIDYNARERDPSIEIHRGRAAAKMRTAIAALEHLSDSRLVSEISVRSEVSENVWMRSFVLREAEFVHSHTVHHHALIAAKLDSLQVATPRHFGVAPSTLNYWKSPPNSN